MSGSFEFARWNACVHRLDLSLCSHPKEFLGNGVRTHVNSKRKIPSTRGSEEDGTHNTASHRTASSTHYSLSCSHPRQRSKFLVRLKQGTREAIPSLLMPRLSHLTTKPPRGVQECHLCVHGPITPTAELYCLKLSFHCQVLHLQSNWCRLVYCKLAYIIQSKCSQPARPHTSAKVMTRGQYHGGQRPMTLFTVQLSFHHRHSTNQVS